MVAHIVVADTIDIVLHIVILSVLVVVIIFVIVVVVVIVIVLVIAALVGVVVIPVVGATIFSVSNAYLRFVGLCAGPPTGKSHPSLLKTKANGSPLEQANPNSVVGLEVLSRQGRKHDRPSVVATLLAPDPSLGRLLRVQLIPRHKKTYN